jgi:hypothetical protein
MIVKEEGNDKKDKNDTLSRGQGQSRSRSRENRCHLSSKNGASQSSIKKKLREGKEEVQAAR